ncbi:MAG: hypothetical protein ABIL58_08240 [Pseudomonadota bacterium]
MDISDSKTKRNRKNQQLFNHVAVTPVVVELNSLKNYEQAIPIQITTGDRRQRNRADHPTYRLGDGST